MTFCWSFNHERNISHRFSYNFNLEEAETLTNYQISNGPLKIIDRTKSIPAPGKYDDRFQGYVVLPIKAEFEDDDHVHQNPTADVIYTASFNRPKLVVGNIAPVEDIGLSQLWLSQLLRKLHR